MRKLSLVLIFVFILSMTSCFNNTEKAETNTKQNTSASLDKNENSEKTEVKKEEKALTDEEKAINLISSYVLAAKKLDFETMGKYITDSNSLPILESYRQAYSKYSISDDRIKELCRARLSTYKITPVSASKNSTGIVVNVSISMVNMESLQNKWMETLCDKYPEYTTLAEDEMTPEVVDVLIETMIEVLKDAQTSVEIKKDFTINTNTDIWVINANNEDFFPSMW